MRDWCGDEPGLRAFVRTTLVGYLGDLRIDVEAAVSAALMLVGCFTAGGKLLIFGNGGSAACAQHLAAELVGRMQLDRDPLPAIALTTDTSVLTAIANDFGFAQVFARQVRALGRPGDVLLAISTSGRSANVLAAVAAGRGRGISSIGLVGAGVNPLGTAVDVAIGTASADPARAQEAHLVVQHGLCASVEAALFGSGAPAPTGPATTASAGRRAGVGGRS